MRIKEHVNDEEDNEKYHKVNSSSYITQAQLNPVSYKKVYNSLRENDLDKVISSHQRKYTLPNIKQ